MTQQKLTQLKPTEYITYLYQQAITKRTKKNTNEVSNMTQQTLSIVTTCCVCGEDKPFSEFKQYELVCYSCKEKLQRGVYIA